MGVSEFVGVLREDEERVAGRSRSPQPPTQAAIRWSLPLTRPLGAHASRFPLVAPLPPPLTRTVADLRWPETPVAHVGQARRHGTAKLGSEADLES